MKWSAFTQAIDSLSRSSHDAPVEFQEMYRRLAHLLMQAVKFYLPHGERILGERAYEEVFDLLELPFDSIAILSETTFSPDERAPGIPGGVEPTITLAFNHHGTTRKATNWCAPNLREPDGHIGDEPWIHLISLAHHSSGRWFVSGVPTVVYKNQADSRGALSMRVAPTPYSRAICAELMKGLGLLEEDANVESLNQMESDLNVVTNLCAMLALKNVGSREVLPDQKLNAKRRKWNKTPLFSYHVLVVDAEPWDGRHSSDVGGGQVRSHIRRGHIRRIHIGPIWVRAAFVRGGRRGFVHKDYEVAGIDLERSE